MHARLRPLAALLVLLVLPACGGTADSGEVSAGSANTTEVAGEPTDAASEDGQGGSIELTDSRGTVVLDAPASRVVALEWSYVEDLLALGVQPVGVADIAGYEKWVDIDPELAEDVADVGTRQEPSLESIAALEPDLIVTDADRHAEIVGQLEAIAPTLLFNPYPAPDEGVTQYERMIASFETIAEAVGRTEEAEQVLADLDAHLAEVADELASADLATTSVALAQGFTSEEVPTIRMFLDSSLAMGILSRLGLSNAWDGEPEQYGFNTVGVEALTQVEDASFLYVAVDDDNIFTGALADNAVWNDLAFVEEGRVYPLGGDTWLFGGPLSAQVLADRTLEVLTSTGGA